MTALVSKCGGMVPQQRGGSIILAERGGGWGGRGRKYLLVIGRDEERSS